MIFQINNQSFLKCNFQYQKELHSAIGKPNQKDLCKFVSAEVFKYEIEENFKNILSFKDNLSYANSFLKFNKDKMNFEGTLPLINKPIEEKNIEFTLILYFEFNGKKLFEKLYSGKTINVILDDIIGLEGLANVKNGDITFNFTFSNPSLGPQAIPLLSFLPDAATSLTADPLNPTFTIKADSSILDSKLLINKIDMADYYNISKKEFMWKYKIDVQNYLWIKGNCEYPETDDLDLDFYFKKPKFEFESLRKNIPFKISGKRNFIVKIIHNNSLDDPFNKNPMKDCSDPKDFVLDEELDFSNIKSPIKGRKK